MEFRFVILCSLLFFQVNIFTQNIPNGDFEKWIFDSTVYYIPENWELQNELEFPLIKQSTGYEGQYALCISVAWDNMLKKYCGATVVNSYQNSDITRFKKLNGYFKGKPGNNDTLMISINLYQDTKLIGVGNLKQLGTKDVWSGFNIPITYYSNKIANRIDITISIITNNGNLKLTTYYIDALKLATADMNQKTSRFI
ncbi:MAG: hypothetical protein K9H58_08205 [Bacteroidales bacterium]|nr:hypothetical protein [Bacteroidales bacterium]